MSLTLILFEYIFVHEDLFFPEGRLGLGLVPLEPLVDLVDEETLTDFGLTWLVKDVRIYLDYDYLA